MQARRLAVSLLLLGFVLWAAFPVHADPAAQVWVDDDYCPTCANSGRTWQQDAFATISAALARVEPGGTVHVLPGRYREDVRIGRPCTLRGEIAGQAVLEPLSADVALTVAANQVTVEGLWVVGGEQAAILVLGPGFQVQPIQEVTIRGNRVQGGYFGVAANIDAGWVYGFLPAAGVRILDNTVSGCTRAVYVYNARAEIRGNDVSQLQPDGIAIYSSQKSVSTIRANKVSVDASNGRAVYILDNAGTVVDGNALVGTTEILTPTTAFALSGYSDLVLSGNTIQGFYWGTNAYSGGSAIITGNTFTDTVAWALNIGTAMTTTQVLVEGNTVKGSYWGLRLDDDGGYDLQAIVRGNTFSDNAVGLQLAASLRKNQVQVHGNAFCRNLVAGLRNESTAQIDATGNWWGANDGPRPGGFGDRIEGAGRAIVDPWLRLSVSSESLHDGHVLLTATLGDNRYPLPGHALTFTTSQGTFVESGSPSWTVNTDRTGRAQATLALPPGGPATVYISPDCGLGLRVSVR